MTAYFAKNITNRWKIGGDSEWELVKIEKVLMHFSKLMCSTQSK